MSVDTITELAAQAHARVQCGLSHCSVWTPEAWKAPKGFPRRELLCCPTMGGKTWRVSAKRLLAWLEAQK